MGAENFNEDMRQFMLSRIERTLFREVSPKYAEISEQYDKQQKKLESMQSDEGKAMLRELDETINHLELIMQEVVYTKAFSDGVRFVMKSIAGGAL